MSAEFAELDGMSLSDAFIAVANIGREDDWAPTPSAVGELDLPAEWQWAPWTTPKAIPTREHYIQVQMLCGGCESRMGLFMTAENTPDAMIVTCRCGFINTWHPR